MANKKPGDLNLASILAILESETSSHEDKADAYSQVSKHMAGDELSLYLYDLDASRLVTLVIRDLASTQPRVCQTSLTVLGFCLSDKEHIKSLSNILQTKCLVAVEKCMLKHQDDKETCTKALWCVGKQNVNDHVLISEAGKKLIKAIGKVWGKWRGKVPSVETEAANAVLRLYQQDKDGIQENLSEFGKDLILSLVHLPPQTGSRLLTMAWELFTINNITSWSKTVVEEYKVAIGPSLKKMMKEKQEVHALKLWSFYVHVLGKELHYGNFINQLLPLAEEGFKSINAEVKIEAFRAWKQLIVNFSLDINILSDLKRIKLIMQVFKFNNAKTEPVAMEKFKIWWFFVHKLGSKAAVYFEQVCIPLLNFCLGIKTSLIASSSRIQIGTSPVTPQQSVMNSPLHKIPVFPALQKYAWQLMSFFYGEIPSDVPLKPVTYDLDSPKIEFLTGQVGFLKHSQWLISTSFEILNLELTPDAAVQHVWFALVAHIKNVLESGFKADVKEMFTAFLTQFQTYVLSQAVQLQSATQTNPGMHLQKILTLFDAVCCLPKKALSSTGFNISNGEKIHGSPALFLLEILLTPALLSRGHGHTIEKYMTMYGKLVTVGIETETGYLEFCQSLLELLNRNRDFVKEPDFMWRLWSRMANPLHDQINKTNEINQGDSLEHNFTCMYNILVFPVQNKLAHVKDQPTYRTMLKTWTDLYSTFSRLSALVTTAEPNICCEELCHVIKGLKEDCRKNLNGLELVAQICLAVVNCVDFGSVGTVGNFNLGGLSPAKWAKKKQKPLENLQSLVELLCKMTEAFTDLTKDFMSTPQKLKSLTSKMDRGSVNLTGILAVMFETFSVIYSHITSSAFLVKLLSATVEPIATLYSLSKEWSGSHFLEKSEKLTTSMCQCIQKHYSGQYDSKFLATLSPLLEVTLFHPKPAISGVAKTFWHDTFCTGPQLELPESFNKIVIEKIKNNRLKIKLPGCKNTKDLVDLASKEVDVVEETPCSELTQGESQAPEPHIPGMPSPRRIRGSFLNKAVSPNIKKSPAKTPGKAPNSAKKKILPADDTQSNVFVVITSPPPKRTPLTEHQIEMFKEKRTMPAMYNSLDSSQDVSLMAHFNSGNSQSHSQFQKILPAPPKNKVVEQEKTNNGDKKEPEQKEEPKIHRWKKRRNSARDDKPSTRQRCVRFSDHSDTVPDPTVSPDATPKDIHHFSVIQSVLSTPTTPSRNVDSSKPTEDDELEKSPSLIGREEGEIACVKQLLSLGDTISKFKSSQDSPIGSPVKDASSAQKTIDSWLIKSPGKQNVQDQNKGTEKSNCAANSRKPRGKKSAETPTPSRVSTRRSSSIDSLQKDCDESKDTSQTSRPASLSLVEETLSPQKLKRNSDDSCFVKPDQRSCDSLNLKTISPGISVVEETQSPKENSVCTSVIPVLSTPPRPSRQSQDVELLDHCEDSNIIPASPTSSKPVRLGTPVLKLKKLTQDEILQYSPSRKDGSQVSSSLTPKRPRGRPRKNFTQSSSDPSSNKSSDKELVNFFLHEHDDFSDLKPIPGETSEEQPTCTEEVTGSQGFSIDKSESKESLPDHSASKGSLSGSESLFTEADVQADSQEYNPCLESTLRDPAAKETKRKKENKIIEDSSEQSLSNTEVLIKEEKEKDVSDVTEKVESSYNPMLESTLATPVRASARKRKQKTPKKLSPESAGPPKRKRRCLANNGSEDNSSQDESGRRTRKISGKTSKPGAEKSSSHTDQVENGETPESTKSSSSSASDKPLVNEESQALISLNAVEKDSSNESKELNVGQDHSTMAKEQKGSNSDNELMKMDELMDIDFNESFSDKEAGKVDTESLMKTPETGKSQPGNVLRTPESAPVSKQLLEKTPENRLVNDTPTRVSTTKKKKEVAQKRSLTKGKGTIPLDLDVPIEPADNSADKTGLGQITELPVTKEESAAETQPDILSNIDSGITEESKQKNSSEEKDVDNKDDPESTCNVVTDIQSGEALDLEKEASAAVSQPKAAVVDTGNQGINEVGTKEKDGTEKTNAKVTTGNEIDDQSSKSLSNSDVEIKDMSEQQSSILDENNVSTSVTSESDDNVPLSTLKSAADDDVPLNSLKNKKDTSPSSDAENLNEPKSSQKKRGRKKIITDGKLKTSPLSQRLRSSGRTLRTRGKRERRSTGDMLSLKSGKTKRRSLEENIQEENIEKHEKEALTEIKDNIGDSECIVIPSQSQEQNTEEKKSEEVSTPVEVTHDISGPDNLKKFNDMMREETPRKTPDLLATRKGLTFADRHSDSKLVTVPRKFERRSMMARRSILKPNSRSFSLDSPSQKNSLRKFHPIKIGHVFSPSASPSAGILKRRRLSGEKAVNSPSPPSKQRRVSFAEPLSVSKQLMEATERPLSPLITQASKVSSSLEKIFTNSLNNESQMTDSLVSSKDSMQCSYASTQESQLNSTQAIFPELTGCNVTVDKVLPQLTSSMWSRGLGTLIKARNIKTIGDLSALTEKQVDELPIRSPKVSVVRKALKKFEEQTAPRSDRKLASEQKTEDSIVPANTSTTNPSEDNADMEIQTILHSGDQSADTTLAACDKTGSVGVPEDNRTAELKSCSKQPPVHVDKKVSEDTKEFKQNIMDQEQLEQTNLLSSVQMLMNQCNFENMKQLKTHEIVKIHQQLSSLTNSVVDVLKERCRSPEDNS